MNNPLVDKDIVSCYNTHMDNAKGSKMTIDQLLDALVLKAGQAQVVRMFKNSAQDGKSKLAQLEKEIADLKAIIMKQNG